MFRIEGILSCFKQLFKNSNLILELHIDTNFGERLLFDVERGLNISFDNHLDSYLEIVSGRPKNVVTAL